MVLTSLKPTILPLYVCRQHLRCKTPLSNFVFCVVKNCQNFLSYPKHYTEISTTYLCPYNYRRRIDQNVTRCLQEFILDCYFRQMWVDRRLRFNDTSVPVLSMNWLFLEKVKKTVSARRRLFWWKSEKCVRHHNNTQNQISLIAVPFAGSDLVPKIPVIVSSLIILPFSGFSNLLVYFGILLIRQDIDFYLFLQVWKPDTYFLNGKKSYLHKITVPNKFLRIKQNGELTYSMR